MKIVTKKFVLTPQLYTQTLRDYALNNYRVLFGFLIFLVLAIFGTGVWGYIALGAIDLYLAWLPFQIVLLIFIAFPLLINPLIVTKSKLNTNDFIEMNYEFDGEKFTQLKCDGSSSTRPYKSITKTYFGREYVILFENMASIYLLPASAFEKLSEFEEVKNALQNVSS